MVPYQEKEDQKLYMLQNPPESIKHIKNLEYDMDSNVYHYKEADGVIKIYSKDGKFIQSRKPKRK